MKFKLAQSVIPDETRDPVQYQPIRFLYILAIFTLFLISFNYLKAEDGIFSIYLDSPTLGKGYTIKTEDQNLFLALWPETLDQEIQVNIQNLRREGWKVPEDKNLISDLYVFDIKMVNPSAPAGGFQKPFDLVLKYNTENNSAKYVYIYNHQLSKWSKIITFKIDPEKKNIQIKLKIPYAQIAILEEKPLFGKASWYPTSLTPRDPLGCACNKYDLGTEVRVTNLSNTKSTITTIISRGPYVKDRIIDLTSQAFSKIANIRQGLIEVKVERLD
jgi:hypothetical protein